MYQKGNNKFNIKKNPPIFKYITNFRFKIAETNPEIEFCLLAYQNTSPSICEK